MSHSMTLSKATTVAIAALMLLAPTHAITAEEPEASQRVDRIAIQMIEVEYQGELPSLDELEAPNDNVQSTLESLQDAGELKVLERIRLVTLGDTTTKVHVGRREPVVVAAQNTGRGRVTQTRYDDVGTIVECTARRRGDWVALELTYEASRLEEIPSDDSDSPMPPVIVTRTLTTDAMIRLDRTLLLAAGGNDPHVILAVSVALLEPAVQDVSQDRPSNDTTTIAADPADAKPDLNARITKYAAALLRRYDEDGNGTLNVNELRDTRYAGRFEKIDTNQDRMISVDEFANMLLERAN